jgi:hypothetical protein
MLEIFTLMRLKKSGLPYKQTPPEAVPAGGVFACLLSLWGRQLQAASGKPASKISIPAQGRPGQNLVTSARKPRISREVLF